MVWRACRLSGFFPLHILINRQQKSWFLFLLFPIAGQWYRSAERDIPTATITNNMPLWPASILSPCPGWLYSSLRKTRPTPIHLLKSMHFLKTLQDIFFWGGWWNRTIFKVFTEFVTLLLFRFFGFLSVRLVASELPQPGVRLTPPPRQHLKLKS